MSYTDLSERETIRFPKIAHKSKSVPGNVKNVQNELDYISAKSWFYCTPHSTNGILYQIQVSKLKLKEKSHL
jgi:hypothetical protein